MGGYLTGCTACTNAKRSGSTAGTWLGTQPRWVEVRSGSVTWLLSRGRGLWASCGRNKGLKNVEVFSDSRQVMYFSSMKKNENNKKQVLSLLAKIKVTRVAHLNLPSLEGGGGGGGVMGPYASAHCFFSNLGKKFSVSRGGSPCPSEGGALTGCTACTNAKGTLTGCTACMGHQRSGSTAGTRPGTLPRWVKVRFCDVTTTPWKGDGGVVGSK